MRGVRGRRWAAAVTAMVAFAASAAAPVSANVVTRGPFSGVPSALSGDFNGDGRADIALVGASGWTGVSTALTSSWFPTGFTVRYGLSPAFAAWASLPGVKMVTGKFDNDAKDDIVLAGVAGWTTLPLARSNGDGTFTVTSVAAGSFPAWAGEPGARVLSGDFNGDGRTDLALAGGSGTVGDTIPVALANGDGTFTITANPVPAFAPHARYPEATVFAEDFNGDGRTDLALLPGGDDLLTYTSLTVAYSTGPGTFSVSRIGAADYFTAYADGRTVTAGDFNGDGRADLAVVLDDMILVEYSRGTGSFDLYRVGATGGYEEFFQSANQPGARIIGTHNTSSSRTDLAVIPAPGAGMGISVAYYVAADEFFVEPGSVPNFVQRAGVSGAQLLTDDFDGDGSEDLALTGGAGWNMVPVAISVTDGTYGEQDGVSPTFAAWAAGASPVTLPPPPPAETLGLLSVLDTGVFSGIMPSVTIGADGLGITSYFVSRAPNEELYNLRVAHCDDAACSTVTTTDIDTVGDVGEFSSIKVGRDGLPLISYISYRNIPASGFTEDLKVAHCNNVACTSATVATLDSAARVNDVTSLTIGGDGFGLIAYQDTTSPATVDKIKVAHCLNILCSSARLSTIDTVKPDNGQSGGYSQVGIATGNHGLGLISYHDGGTNKMLKVAACTDADCSNTVKSIVDRALSGPSDSGGFSSVTFGLDGLALISYNANFTSAGADLKVAHCLNVYCTASTTITADTGGYVGWNTSIAMGGDGLGVVSYYDGTNKDLKVAHCANLICSSATATTVDAFDDEGFWSSITAGSDGLPLIAYLGQGPLGTVLRVVHCGNSDCTAPIVAPF